MVSKLEEVLPEIFMTHLQKMWTRVKENQYTPTSATTILECILVAQMFVKRAEAAQDLMWLYDIQLVLLDMHMADYGFSSKGLEDV